MRQYELLDHLLEFKYLSLKQLGMSAQQVRAESRETLAALPKVQQALSAAEKQLAHYQQALAQRYQSTLRLHTHAVVSLGFERLIFSSQPAQTNP